MNCPRHQEPLEHRIEGSQSVYRCPECAGLWLPGAAIDALLGSGERLKLQSLCTVKESELRCPNDGRLLGEGKAGVTIDFCTKCHGLWLDWGELEALQRRRKITPHKKSDPGELHKVDSDELFFGGGLALALGLFD